MSLSEEYNRKRKNSAGEVLEELRDGDYVLSAQAMAEPVTLLEAMPLLKKKGPERHHLQLLYARGGSALVP